MHSNENSYINIIWRDWLAQAEKKPLDRWLRSWFKQNRNLTRAQKLSLSQAMFNAMRFVQAAHYLELCFELSLQIEVPLVNQEQSLDLLAWDKQWQLEQLDQINSSAFWFWVGLLTLRTQDPAELLFDFQDDERRLAWFNANWQNTLFAQEAELLAPEKLLLLGIRPQWQPLLTQRAILNDWTEQTLLKFIQQQAQPAPLWLRLANENEDSQALVKELNDHGVKAELTEQGICVSGGQDISLTQAYKQGRFEIQDLASQQIALAVQAQPGQKVWDCCAGAGGKSLAIASKMNNKGCVVATDLHAYKLDEVKKRAKRAGYHHIRQFVWTGDAKLKLPREAAQQAGFDWVLIDAPCTSAGTWRRNPDAKWRFSEVDTQQQLAIQKQILSFSHAAVRKGGYLVYATCSWQVSENEAQIADFLHSHPHFELVEQKLLGSPNDNSDTMFVAVMQKKH